VYKCISRRIAEIEIIYCLDCVFAQFGGLQKVDQILFESGVRLLNLDTQLNSGQIDQKDSLDLFISRWRVTNWTLILAFSIRPFSPQSVQVRFAVGTAMRRYRG
jgi:hypothetical protein